MKDNTVYTIILIAYILFVGYTLFNSGKQDCQWLLEAKQNQKIFSAPAEMKQKCLKYNIKL